MFRFTDEYLLEDDRVLLRPLQAGDVDHLMPFSILEPDLWTYSLVSAGGGEPMLHYLDAAINARKNEKEYPFIVFDKHLNQYAGCTRFYDIQLAMSTLQLGYTWYGKKFQRSGLNRHCKFLLLQFAFETMGMERVEFRADFNNKRSIRAMEQIGCKVEGVLRSHGIKPDGTRRDSIVLSILKNEWENVKRELKLKMY